MTSEELVDEVIRLYFDGMPLNKAVTMVKNIILQQERGQVREN